MEIDERQFRENTPYDAMGDYSPLLSTMKQDASQQDEDSLAVELENKEKKTE